MTTFEVLLIVFILASVNNSNCNENVLVQLFRHSSAQNVFDDKNLALMFQENKELRQEKEEWSAEKKRLVTENKELHTKIDVAHTKIKALISQRSAVFGNDCSSSTVSYQVYTIGYYQSLVLLL